MTSDSSEGGDGRGGEGREVMKEGRERRWCYLEAGINNQGGENSKEKKSILWCVC